MAKTGEIREAKSKINSLAGFVSGLEDKEKILIRDFTKFLQTFDTHREIISKLLKLSRELRMYPLANEEAKFFSGIYKRHFKQFEEKNDWSGFKEFIAKLDEYINETEKRFKDAEAAGMLKRAKWDKKKYHNQPAKWLKLLLKINDRIREREHRVYFRKTGESQVKKEINRLVKQLSETVISEFRSLLEKEAVFQNGEIRLIQAESEKEVEIGNLLSGKYMKLKEEMQSKGMEDTILRKKLGKIMELTGEEAEEEETALQLNKRLRQLLGDLRSLTKKIEAKIRHEIDLLNTYTSIKVKQIASEEYQRELARNESWLMETVVDINRLIMQANEKVIRPFNAYFRKKQDINKKVSETFSDKKSPVDVLRSILKTAEAGRFQMIKDTDIAKDIRSFMEKKVSVKDIKSNLRKYASNYREVIEYLREVFKHWDMLDEKAKRFVNKAFFVSEYRRLADGATIDTLTKIPTRKALLRALKQEISRCNFQAGRPQRETKYFFLVFFDIDNFKEFNDTYGHKAGDMVLVAVAQSVKNRLRDYDQIFRYGGEEFCIILPMGKLPDPVPSHEQIAKNEGMVVERIRMAVEKDSEETMKVINEIFSKVKPNNPTITRITISLGVAIAPHDAISPDPLIKKADEAMYRAKRAGRNMVVFAGLPSDWRIKKRKRPETEGAEPESKAKSKARIDKRKQALDEMIGRAKARLDVIHQAYVYKQGSVLEIPKVRKLINDLPPEQQIKEIEEFLRFIMLDYMKTWQERVPGWFRKNKLQKYMQKLKDRRMKQKHYKELIDALTAAGSDEIAEFLDPFVQEMGYWKELLDFAPKISNAELTPADRKRVERILIGFEGLLGLGEKAAIKSIRYKTVKSEELKSRKKGRARAKSKQSSEKETVELSTVK